MLLEFLCNSQILFNNIDLFSNNFHVYQRKIGGLISHFFTTSIAAAEVFPVCSMLTLSDERQGNQ